MKLKMNWVFENDYNSEVNMINNNDIIELSMIEYYYGRYEQCLSSNVLHNCNSYELNAPLGHIFKWCYEACNSQYILSKANRHIC